MVSEFRLVAIVDDDESIRESLPDLLGSFGYKTMTYASADGFLAGADFDRVGCLILDVAMPGMSGPELQQELSRRHLPIPIVFITAHSDEGGWPALQQSGAVAYLVKPFSQCAIVDAVRAAFRA